MLPSTRFKFTITTGLLLTAGVMFSVGGTVVLRAGEAFAAGSEAMASGTVSAGGAQPEMAGDDAPEAEAPEAKLPKSVLIAHGKTFSERACASCHAVGASGASPMADAPAFRDLNQRYPIRDLEEGLAEGILTGHDDMTVPEMEPEDIDAFLTYLESIQTRPEATPQDGEGVEAPDGPDDPDDASTQVQSSDPNAAPTDAPETTEQP